MRRDMESGKSGGYSIPGMESGGWTWCQGILFVYMPICVLASYVCQCTFILCTSYIYSSLHVQDKGHLYIFIFLFKDFDFETQPAALSLSSSHENRIR